MNFISLFCSFWPSVALVSFACMHRCYKLLKHSVTCLVRVNACSWIRFCSLFTSRLNSLWLLHSIWIVWGWMHACMAIKSILNTHTHGQLLWSGWVYWMTREVIKARAVSPHNPIISYLKSTPRPPRKNGQCYSQIWPSLLEEPPSYNIKTSIVIFKNK